MQTEIIELLKQLGRGKMSALAYDTAWVARLGGVDADLSNHALEWLSENQLPDGSWGAEEPYYYHDRVISTLAAMIALTHRGRRARDRQQIDKGLLALEQITSGATKGLMSDPNGATVGFEMVVPTLVAEAENLGIIKQQGDRILGRIGQLRKIKLNTLRGKKINRHLTAAFSAEMAGMDDLGLLDVENLLETNGSVGHSPSATAYYLFVIKPNDEKALGYLHQVVNSSDGVPDLFPFETFEANWVLWNLALAENNWNEAVRKEFLRGLGIVKAAWHPEKGIGLSSEYTVPDGDDTLITHDLLARFDKAPDIKTIFAFEESDHFCAYPFEAHSSSSVNIHAMGTLKQAGFKSNSPVILKIKKYLQNSRNSAGYWFDKWNLSPYYTTAHAIIVCAGYADHLVNQSVDWIVQTQNKDGSWGYQFATAEETAYCIQALVIWKLHGGKVSSKTIKNAVSWLSNHVEPPYLPLWIGKGLYAPELIVRSTILSAMMLAKEDH